MYPFEASPPHSHDRILQAAVGLLLDNAGYAPDRTGIHGTDHSLKELSLAAEDAVLDPSRPLVSIVKLEVAHPSLLIGVAHFRYAAKHPTLNHKPAIIQYPSMLDSTPSYASDNFDILEGDELCRLLDNPQLRTFPELNESGVYDPYYYVAARSVLSRTMRDLVLQQANDLSVSASAPQTETPVALPLKQPTSSNTLSRWLQRRRSK